MITGILEVGKVEYAAYTQIDTPRTCISLELSHLRQCPRDVTIMSIMDDLQAWLAGASSAYLGTSRRSTA